MTYDVTSAGEEFTLDIRGFEPAGTAANSSRPVYLLLPGNGEFLDASSGTLRFAREMAMRGFVAAIAEMPALWGLQHVHRDRDSARQESNRHFTMQCTNSSVSIEAVANRTLAYGGPGDTTSQSALATLCRRAGADCSLGIALHGHSLGALIIPSGFQFATGVTAALVTSAGPIAPGAGSCCGRAIETLPEDLSCCPASANESGIVGGDVLPCMLDGFMSSYLPRSKRRMVIAADDQMYGCEREHIAARVEAGYSQREACNLQSPVGAIAQCRLASGYDCGTELECLHADGSGYVVPAPNASSGHPYMYPPDFEGPSIPIPPFDRRFVLHSSGEWGLQPSMDWIANAALRPNY